MQKFSSETCTPRGRNVLNLFSNFKLANEAASQSRLPNGTVKRAIEPDRMAPSGPLLVSRTGDAG